jgi:hypothetical protein
VEGKMKDKGVKMTSRSGQLGGNGKGQGGRQRERVEGGKRP